jgi:hypothetical protein
MVLLRVAQTEKLGLKSVDQRVDMWVGQTVEQKAVPMAGRWADSKAAPKVLPRAGQ